MHNEKMITFRDIKYKIIASRPRADGKAEVVFLQRPNGNAVFIGTLFPNGHILHMVKTAF